MSNFLKLFGFGLVALTLSACNTVEGVGQDVEAAGEQIEETANDNK
ncbi:MAG: entericidin, EcnA/B family [Ponticaulis sp.]|nr:entericidin, EcnA/B family [Ponticaulis sp.]|tara:strand:+ start:22860 stop:22997 length:138 start_codon:yes stop_codon:yes gene_type:complete